MAKPKATKTNSKKRNKTVPSVGKAYVTSGYNNTIVTITDLDGNTICWSSSGNSGFRGSRQSTPYAAAIVGENAAKEASSLGLKEVGVVIKGVGSGKSHCVKAIRNAGLVINKIVDVTPIAHGGCRPRKRKRG